MSCLIAGWEAVASSKQMCYSKNHSYSPHKQIFFLNPPPLYFSTSLHFWKFQFSFILFFRRFGLLDPLANLHCPLWAGYPWIISGNIQSF